MDLLGKNIVYIGGFGGIGKECCKALLSAGVEGLAIFDKFEDRTFLNDLQSANSKVKIFYFKLDIANKAEIERAYEEAAKSLGYFDVVINGSGQMDDRLIDASIQINLLGVINSCMSALKYMDKSRGGRGGRILNVSSVVGLEATPMFAVYSAAKTGLTTFTRAMACPVYYERTGVAFIAVCPGFTDTDLLKDPESKCIFQFPSLRQFFERVKRQSPEECAQNMLEVLGTARNGTVWMLDIGEIKEVVFPTFWKPSFSK